MKPPERNPFAGLTPEEFVALVIVPVVAVVATVIFLRVLAALAR